MHPYGCIDTTAAWKKPSFILSDWSDLWLYTSKKVSKIGDRSRGRLKGSLFNSYNTETYGRVQISLYIYIYNNIKRKENSNNEIAFNSYCKTNQWHSKYWSKNISFSKIWNQLKDQSRKTCILFPYSTHTHTHTLTQTIDMIISRMLRPNN